MTVALSQSTIPYAVRMLKAMSEILTKAEAYAESKKIDPSVLLNARLAPDMHPLTRQVQIATDMVKGGAARLSNQTPPSYSDTESTFQELRERLAKTIEYAQSVPAVAIDAGEPKTITMKAGANEFSFSREDYAFGFVMANLYFHATTMYAILRHNGVPLGKGDFMGVKLN